MKQYDDDRPYISAETRRSVKVEAGHACSVKNCNDHTYLEIHHINENREDNSIENLILLCTKHHKMAHNQTIDRKALKEYKALLKKDTIQKNEKSVEPYIVDEDEHYGFLDYLEIINKRNEEIQFIINNFMKREKIHNDLTNKTADKVFALNASMKKNSKEQSTKNMKKILKLLSIDTQKYSEFISSQLKILSESRKDLFNSIAKAVELSTSNHQVPTEIALNVFKEPLIEFKSRLHPLIESTNLFISKLEESSTMLKESNKSNEMAVNALKKFIVELEEFIISIDNL